MQKFKLIRRTDRRDQVEVPFRGHDLLTQPLYNKGTVFSAEERRQFNLEGLLPQAIASEDVQANRTYETIMRDNDPIERYIALSALQDRNEVLFYKLLQNHLEEMIPIIYTPTVGEACQRYSHIFQRGRGVWITPDHKGHIDEVLANAPCDDVRMIVVTDNERILGLGDLGAGGMGIPIGKLALYSAAGIHPSQTLPVCLDVGTNNEALLNDDVYIGWPHHRLGEAEYDALVEEFIQAVKTRFPKAVVQWEDFKKNNGFRLLDRYREQLPSFNDDIEGTAAVTLAGVMGACRITGTPIEQQRTVILGAGAAGTGIARQLRQTLKLAGLHDDELREAIVLLDSDGLLMKGTDKLDQYKAEFAWTRQQIADAGIDPDGARGLEEVVRALKPGILIGTSGQPGLFTETVIKTMWQATPRPIILPISNPTANAEATPKDLFKWTDGQAVVATGTAFDSVEYKGQTYRAAQGNNVYIFPGVGIGALAAKAKRLDDQTFAIAAKALAAYLSDESLARGMVYPPLAQLRDISAHIAFAVAQEAVQSGKADEMDDATLRARIEKVMWEPQYPELIPV